MTRLRLLLTAGITLLAFAPIAADAHAQGVDTTCSLPLTKTDPATVNVAFRTRRRSTGSARTRRAGHATEDHGPVPARAVLLVQRLRRRVAPDRRARRRRDPPGPRLGQSVRGGRRPRHDEPRDYTAYVDFGAVPKTRAPNTIYTGTGQTAAPNMNGTLILRVYVPDRGRDETGGVGLPTMTLERVDDGGRPSRVAVHERGQAGGRRHQRAHRRRGVSAGAARGLAARSTRRSG